MKKIKLYLLAVVLTVVLLSGCSSKNEINQDTSEEKYVPVEIETVKKDTIFNTTIYSGRVYADKDVMVLPKIPGKVTKVFVGIGQRVKKGDILFTLDKEDIEKQVEQARVAVEGARANYELTQEKIENAKTTFERMKKLYEEGAISQAQYEQAQLAASDKSLEAAQSALNQAEVAYNQAVDALDNTSIESPIEGIISSINIETGEMASNAQPAVTIVDIDKVYIQINVTGDMVNEIRNGQEVKVSIPSISQEDFTGKIKSISPVVDPRTQLYPVKIYLENTNHEIKPGMLAQVKINTDIRQDVIVVSSEAIVQINGESYVYTAENGKALRKKVTTGLDTGTYVEIKEGLKEGESVIVKGQNYVEDNTTVKIVRGE